MDSKPAITSSIRHRIDNLVVRVRSHFSINLLLISLILAVLLVVPPIRLLVDHLSRRACRQEEERCQQERRQLEAEALQEMLMQCGRAAGSATHDTRNSVRCL